MALIMKDGKEVRTPGTAIPGAQRRQCNLPVQAFLDFHGYPGWNAFRTRIPLAAQIECIENMRKRKELGGKLDAIMQDNVGAKGQISRIITEIGTWERAEIIAGSMGVHIARILSDTKKSKINLPAIELMLEGGKHVLKRVRGLSEYDAPSVLHALVVGARADECIEDAQKLVSLFEKIEWCEGNKHLKKDAEAMIARLKNMRVKSYAVSVGGSRVM